MLVIEVINGDADSARLVPTNLVQQSTTAGASEVIVADTATRASETIMRRLLNALNFARTQSDQLRVVVDTNAPLPGGTASIGYVSGQLWVQNAYAGPYAAGPFTVDDRENLRMAYRENFNDVRQGRWLIT